MEKHRLKIKQPLLSSQLAKLLGFHQRSLLHWISKGWISDPPKDGAGRRLWYPENVREALRFSKKRLNKN